MAVSPDPFVTTAWLAAHLDDPDLRLIDASWWFPHEARDAGVEFENGRLPGAVFFDIDAIVDQTSPFPHMLPKAEVFAEAVGRLGLGDASSLVVYETEGPRSAARAWWSFRVMGHSDVRVLDGGLRKWRREGRPVTSGAPNPLPASFTPRFDRRLVRDIDEMLRLMDEPSAQIADARPAARFNGTAAEPREGLRSGHMPGARSLPASDFYNPDGTMKDRHDLLRMIAAAGVDPAEPLVATCGSGITACTIALAMARLGHADTAVYDGSWAEWGAMVETPVVTGA